MDIGIVFLIYRVLILDVINMTARELMKIYILFLHYRDLVLKFSFKAAMTKLYL